MWALVLPDGRISQLSEEKHPVHGSLTWFSVDDEVTTRWTVVDGELVEPVPPPLVNDLGGKAWAAIVAQLFKTEPFASLPEVIALKDSEDPGLDISPQTDEGSTSPDNRDGMLSGRIRDWLKI